MTLKRLTSLFLTLILAISCCPVVLAQEAAIMPVGFWVETDGTWIYLLQEDYVLSPQAAAAFEAQYPGMVTDGKLTAGSVISHPQLQIACPEAAGVIVPPDALPETFAESNPFLPPIEPFELTGEWFYGEDGVLYYDAGEGYQTLTKDDVFAMLNGNQPQSVQETQKKVYFTFDDAPSRYTMELLATLDALDVPATFFVVGAYVKTMPVFLRAIYEEGHVIGNHSFSHDQDILGGSVSSCLNDFQKCQNRVNEALGFEYPMTVLRVPYGSSTISYESKQKLQQQGYLWIDWNALNGDAEAGIDSQEEAYDYAIRTASRCDGDVVMLMHDGKKRTIRMLPDLVKYFRENGYEFAVVSTDITEKIPGVRMGFPISE